MALPIEYALRERTRLVSYSGCLPWVNESQCFTYLIYKVHEISSNNKMSLIIKSGIYAERLTSNDKRERERERERESEREWCSTKNISGTVFSVFR